MMASQQVPLVTGSKRSTQFGGAEPPEWANELMAGMINLRERFDHLAPKIEQGFRSSRGGSLLSANRSYPQQGGYTQSAMNGQYTNSPITQTTNMLAHQQTGTMADESMFQHQPGEEDVITHGDGDTHAHSDSMRGSAVPEDDDDMYTEDHHHEHDQHHLHVLHPDHDMRGVSEYNDRENSPGQQYLEEELYKLTVKPTTGSQSVATHKTWEVAREDAEDYEEGDAQAAVTESGLPEIPDGNTAAYTERRGASPPLPPIPQDRQDLMHDGQIWQPSDYNNEPRTPPWQRVHQRLLSWAIVWPMSELDNALNSTTRGKQVDEVALSIWSTQTYKRYVRSKMTDSPPGRVDRLFVPPNMADAISTAVFNGRHGDACGMLRDLWAPFGLEGIPRLLIVLAKHRTDENHWVVHRYVICCCCYRCSR